MLFQRFSNMFQSIAFAFVRRFENPERMIELAVAQINSNYNKLRINIANSMVAYETLCVRIEEVDKARFEWGNQALTAAKSGNTQAAREAVIREQSYLSMRDHLLARKDPMNERIEHMRQYLLDLEIKKTELGIRKDDIIAGFQMSETRKELRSLIDGSRYGDVFKQLEERTSKNERFESALDKLDGTNALGTKSLDSDFINQRLLELSQNGVEPKLLGTGK